MTRTTEKFLEMVLGIPALLIILFYLAVCMILDWTANTLIWIWRIRFTRSVSKEVLRLRYRAFLKKKDLWVMHQSFGKEKRREFFFRESSPFREAANLLRTPGDVLEDILSE